MLAQLRMHITASPHTRFTTPSMAHALIAHPLMHADWRPQGSIRDGDQSCVGCGWA